MASTTRRRTGWGWWYGWARRGREDRPGSDARSFVSWLSHRDLAYLAERATEAPGITYEIAFGASDNTWKIYDTLHARKALGYAPRDNAERFRGR